MKIKLYIVKIGFALNLILLLLPSCGVRKGVSAAEKMQDSNQTPYEGRIKNEIVSLDTTKIEKEVIGKYIINGYDFNGEHYYQYDKHAKYDSLILREDGYYALYKCQQLLDSGLYKTAIQDTLRYCLRLELSEKGEETIYIKDSQRNALIITLYRSDQSIMSYHIELHYIPRNFSDEGYKELVVLHKIGECLDIGYSQQFWKATN